MRPYLQNLSRWLPKRTACIVALMVLMVCAGCAYADTTSPVRVIRFPDDRSLGLLKIRDAEVMDTTSEWWWGTFSEWEDLGEAQGEIAVPAGKHAVLMVGARGWQDLSPLKELPPDSLYGVVIRFSGRTFYEARDHNLPPAGDACLRHIAALKGLNTLMLSETKITNEGLEPLGQLRSLKHLAVIAETLDDTGLAHIARVKSLTGLRIYTNTGISDDSMRGLSQLTSLRELRLAAPHVSQAGMSHLGNLTSLHTLELSAKVDSEGLTHLGALSRIQRLRLRIRNTTASDLSFLSKLEHLQSLGLVYTSGDDFLLHVSRTPHLKKLWLEANLRGTSLRHLANLSELERLSFHDCLLTDDMLADLVSAPTLKAIHAGGDIGWDTALTDKGLAHLKKIKSLESVSLMGGRYTDTGLKHLSELENLKRLNIPNNHGFSDAGMQHLDKLDALEELQLRDKRFTKTTEAKK